MYKKTIKYVDYNGTERIEDFYFNLNRAELLEDELRSPGIYTTKLEEIIKAKDVSKLVILFKDFITRSYGRKSADGRRFEKSQEILDEFIQTEAYNQLFMELATNTDSAIEFINGIMPELTPEQKAEATAQSNKLMSEIGLA